MPDKDNAGTATADAVAAQNLAAANSTAETGTTGNAAGAGATNSVSSATATTNNNASPTDPKSPVPVTTGSTAPAAGASVVDSGNATASTTGEAGLTVTDKPADHEGFRERIEVWARRLQCDIYEDIESTCEAMARLGGDMPANIAAIKLEYGIK
jgi:hypothetical protein